MNKPIIGIVGRENLSQRDNKTSVISTDDKYRRAIIKSRRYSNFNTSNSGL